MFAIGRREFFRVGERILNGTLASHPKSLSAYTVKNVDDKLLKIVNNESPDRKSLSFNYFWLRDHCRCNGCYNSKTFQRKLTVDHIPLDIKPTSARVDKGLLRIIWEDGHASEFSVAWLEESTHENYVKSQTRAYKFWNGENVSRLPIAHVDGKELLRSDDALRRLMKSILDYGVGFVDKVGANVAATEEVIRRISHIQTTLFGTMWEFSDVLDHSDTAYTREDLDCHTDNTYLSEPAGLQVLHCIHHDGVGGENTLVDGYAAADVLKSSYPDAFKRLATMSIPAEYIEKGHHYKLSAPIIRVNPATQQIEQIRFNSSDRATVALPDEDIMVHYKDLKIFTDIIKQPSRQWDVKLTPGTVLVFDNYRVLHGRKAYTGQRKMCGCYVARSDFLSKARVLKLIE